MIPRVDLSREQMDYVLRTFARIRTEHPELF
jgi:hypothetical protein